MEVNKQSSTIKSSASAAIIDQGLRSYMLKVYNYMASGVLLTGFVALALFKMSVVSGPSGEIIGLTSLGNAIYNSGLALGYNVSSSWNSILYEFWYCKDECF